MKISTIETIVGHARRRGTVMLVLWLALAGPAAAGVGDLDPSFAQGGTMQVAGNAGPSVLELPDGRILVVGISTSAGDMSTQGRAIASNRYLASGEPDPSFGQDGRVVASTSLEIKGISAAVLQSDGSVIVAGSYWRGGGLPFVARLGPTGALDPSFGSGGISEPNTGGTEPFYSSVVILQNGEILAAISDWTIDRLDRFAADGRYLGSLSGAIAPARMALQSDGRLIVSGYHRTLKKSVVTRLDTDGRVDSTFGRDGFAEIDDGYTGNLSVEPGGDRIVLCGAGVVRLTPDGHTDTTFGQQGTGYVAFGRDGVPMFDFCNRVVALNGGAVVFIGIRQGQAAGGFDQAFVAGLTANGTVDTRFGGGTGASALNLGAIKGSTSWWFDYSSSFTATWSGDGLLTWWSDADAELKLVRVGLGGVPMTPSTPPPSTVPATTPASTPATTPASTPVTAEPSSGGNGGGGALAWGDMGIFGFALCIVAVRGRRRATAYPAAILAHPCGDLRERAFSAFGCSVLHVGKLPVTCASTSIHGRARDRGAQHRE